MPSGDVVALLDRAQSADEQAARDSENLAMLVDRDDYAVNFGYSNAVTDPNDPAVKAERARRKRARIKPPPLPILAPVGLRAPEVTAELIEQYRAAVVDYQPPPPAENNGGLAAVIGQYS